MAIGALAALRRLGLDCPRDISVFGFDDIPMARYAFPPLTTIRQPMSEIGRRTVKLMIDILEGRQHQVVSVTLRHRLIVRHSVARNDKARMCG
jgi:LacI family repressor for deo operon, udp, cdd, tsx, nupC, and nupG